MGGKQHHQQKPRQQQQSKQQQQQQQPRQKGEPNNFDMQRESSSSSFSSSSSSLPSSSLPPTLSTQSSQLSETDTNAPDQDFISLNPPATTTSTTTTAIASAATAAATATTTPSTPLLNKYLNTVTFEQTAIDKSSPSSSSSSSLSQPPPPPASSTTTTDPLDIPSTTTDTPSSSIAINLDPNDLDLVHNDAWTGAHMHIFFSRVNLPSLAAPRLFLGRRPHLYIKVFQINPIIICSLHVPTVPTITYRLRHPPPVHSPLHSVYFPTNDKHLSRAYQNKIRLLTILTAKLFLSSSEVGVVGVVMEVEGGWAP